jgi:vitamin B12 transporter
VKKIIASIFITLTLWAQNVKISGYVINSDKNAIKDAVIEIKGESTHLKTISDTIGFFNFKVKPGIFKISAKHIAYKPFEKEIKVHTDTLLFIWLEPRTFKFGEVTVTATRYETNSFDVPNFVEIAKSEDIEKVKTLSFSDILKNLTSVYIRDYGGMPAQLKTISLRGTGSEHSVFLLNGMRISSYQNGVVDLSLIPVEIIDRVEVIHSNISSLYGADAIGGVINIITKGESPRKFLELTVGSGDFGYRKFNSNISGEFGTLAYLGSFTRSYGPGNFKYKYKIGNDEINLRRKNAHFSITNLYFDISAQNTSLSFVYVRSNRGIPSQTTKFDPASTANQLDWDLTLSISKLKATAKSTIKMNFLYKNSYLRYTNNDIIIAGSGIDSYSHNLFYSNLVNALFKLRQNFLISSGIETSFGLAQGNSFEKAKRFNIGLFIGAEGNFKLKFLPEIKIYPMIRNDYFSDFGSRTVYRAGLNIKLFGDPILNLKFSYGTGFRAPTFNDLYWLGSGNKNLKPEKSNGADLGFLFFSSFNKNAFNAVKFEISLFNINITDRIVWLPSRENQSIWRPINIDEVNSRGIEFAGEVKILKLVKIAGNFSIVESIRRNKRTQDDETQNKYLIYIPKSTGNLKLEVELGNELGNFFFISQVNYTGLRYTSETNDRWLNPYYVVDLSCGFNYEIGFFFGKAKFSVKNLLNENYETMVGYPMPLRSFFFELTSGIKEKTKTKRED